MQYQTYGDKMELQMEAIEIQEKIIKEANKIIEFETLDNKQIYLWRN